MNTNDERRDRRRPVEEKSHQDVNDFMSTINEESEDDEDDEEFAELKEQRPRRST